MNTFEFYSYKFAEAKSLEEILKEKPATLQELRKEDVVRLLSFNGAAMGCQAGSEAVIDETCQQLHQHLSKWTIERSSIKR